MDATQPSYKPIKFQIEIWQDIKDLADELAAERGRAKEDLPKVVAEAVKYFKENRPKPEVPGVRL